MKLEQWQSQLGDAVEGRLHPALMRAIGEPYAIDRLGIYRRNYLGTRQDTLAAIYPICLALIGRERFLDLGKDFIERQHPDHGNLNQYGYGFAEALAADYPQLQDIAWLEFWVHRAYYAIDDPACDWQALQQVAETEYENLRLLPSHSLKLMSSALPLDDIWESGSQAQDRIRLLIKQPPNNTFPYGFCISRLGVNIRVTRVEKNDLEVLQLILAGKSLAAIVESHASAGPFLQQAIANGWVCGFADDRGSAAHV